MEAELVFSLMGQSHRPRRDQTPDLMPMYIGLIVLGGLLGMAAAALDGIYEKVVRYLLVFAGLYFLIIAQVAQGPADLGEYWGLAIIGVGAPGGMLYLGGYGLIRLLVALVSPRSGKGGY